MGSKKMSEVKERIEKLNEEIKSAKLSRKARATIKAQRNALLQAAIDEHSKKSGGLDCSKAVLVRAIEIAKGNCAQRNLMHRHNELRRGANVLAKMQHEIYKKKNKLKNYVK